MAYENYNERNRIHSVGGYRGAWNIEYLLGMRRTRSLFCRLQPHLNRAASIALLQDRPCGSLDRAALNELVAQLVEQRPFKAWVLGSIPSELTIPTSGRKISPHSLSFPAL
jgi:hypothetical protein